MRYYNCTCLCMLFVFVFNIFYWHILWYIRVCYYVVLCYLIRHCDGGHICLRYACIVIVASVGSYICLYSCALFMKHLTRCARSWWWYAPWLYTIVSRSSHVMCVCTRISIRCCYTCVYVRVVLVLVASGPTHIYIYIYIYIHAYVHPVMHFHTLLYIKLAALNNNMRMCCDSC